MAADEKEKDDGFLLLQKAGTKTFPGEIKDPDQSSVMSPHEVRGHHQIGATRQGVKNDRRRRGQRGEEEEESVTKLHHYTDVTNLQKKSEAKPMTDPPPLVPIRTSRSLFPSFRGHHYLTLPKDDAIVASGDVSILPITHNAPMKKESQYYFLF